MVVGGVAVITVACARRRQRSPQGRAGASPAAPAGQARRPSRSGPRMGVPGHRAVAHPEPGLLHHPHGPRAAVGLTGGLAAAHPRDGRPRADLHLPGPPRPAAHRGLGHAVLRVQRGRRRPDRQRLVVRRARARAARRGGREAGADAVRQTSRDGWDCGTPLAALTDPNRNAMLAIAMNGQPLPVQHGFPVRMVVPGLYGYVSATKWLVDLEVTTFDKFSAYWTERGWSEKGPVKTQSRIDVPAQRGDGEGRDAARSAAAPGPSTPGSRRWSSSSTAPPGRRPSWAGCPAPTPGCSGPARSTSPPASTVSWSGRPTVGLHPDRGQDRRGARRRHRMGLHSVQRPVVFSRGGLGMAEQVASRRGVLFGALLLGAGVAVSSRCVRARAHPRLRGAAVLGLLRPRRLQVLDRDASCSSWRWCSWSRRCGSTASSGARRPLRG